MNVSKNDKRFIGLFWIIVIEILHSIVWTMAIWLSGWNPCRCYEATGLFLCWFVISAILAVVTGAVAE